MSIEHLLASPRSAKYATAFCIATGKKVEWSAVCEFNGFIHIFCLFVIGFVFFQPYTDMVLGLLRVGQNYLTLILLLDFFLIHLF